MLNIFDINFVNKLSKIEYIETKKYVQNGMFGMCTNTKSNDIIIL